MTAPNLDKPAYAAAADLRAYRGALLDFRGDPRDPDGRGEKAARYIEDGLLVVGRRR